MAKHKKKTQHDPYCFPIYHFHHTFLTEHRTEILADPTLNIDLMAYILGLIYKCYKGECKKEQYTLAREKNTIHISAKILQKKYKRYLASLKYLIANEQIVQ